MTTTEQRSLAELRWWLRATDLAHDPWGTAMSWMFAVCRVLDAMGEHVPDEWEFRRGIGDRESVEQMAGTLADEDADFPDCEVATMVLNEQLDADTLLWWGRVLNRYLAMCKRAGRDY